MKRDSQAFGSEYAMTAGDNAASRKEINASIKSKGTANEHSFRAENEKVNKDHQN